MAKILTEGTCSVCSKNLAKRSVSAHLKSCLRKELTLDDLSGRPRSGYHLVVEAAYAEVYWLHLAVRQDATFGDLDSYLRGVWLECCGHMSGFTIGDTDIVSGQPELFYGGSEGLEGEDEDEAGDEAGDEVEAGALAERAARVQEILQGAFGIDMGGVLGQLGGFHQRVECGMDTPVADLLSPKLHFNYDYDYGSTTSLKLRVVRELETVRERATVE